MQNSIIIDYSSQSDGVNDAKTNHTNAVIWLHGLGASADDFVPALPHLSMQKQAQFIFANAPKQAVSINGGFVMPAWYDIYSADIDACIDIDGIIQSSHTIASIFKTLVTEGKTNIILAGFSQGGVIAYHTALILLQDSKFAPYVAGILALSTYFATNTIFLKNNILRYDVPILIHHGLHDTIVPKNLADKALQNLQSLGFAPNSQTYPMAHEVCAPQLKDIGRWIDGVLQ